MIKNEVASAIGCVAKVSDFNLALNIDLKVESNTNFATFRWVDSFLRSLWSLSLGMRLHNLLPVMCMGVAGGQGGREALTRWMGFVKKAS